MLGIVDKASEVTLCVSIVSRSLFTRATGDCEDSTFRQMMAQLFLPMRTFLKRNAISAIFSAESGFAECRIDIVWPECPRWFTRRIRDSLYVTLSQRDGLVGVCRKRIMAIPQKAATAPPSTRKAYSDPLLTGRVQAECPTLSVVPLGDVRCRCLRRPVFLLVSWIPSLFMMTGPLLFRPCDIWFLRHYVRLLQICTTPCGIHLGVIARIVLQLDRRGPMVTPIARTQLRRQYLIRPMPH